MPSLSSRQRRNIVQQLTRPQYWAVSIGSWYFSYILLGESINKLGARLFRTHTNRNLVYLAVANASGCQASTIDKDGTSTAACPPPYNSTQRTCEQAQFDLAIMTTTCESVRMPSSWPSSPYSGIKGRFEVSCIECDKNDERDWQGRVIGRGLHGSVSAFRTRARHRYRLFMDHRPLIKLLTVCIECCTKLALYHELDQIDQIFGLKGNNETTRGMVLRISYKEIEEFVSSRVIVLESVLLSVGTIKTICLDGTWRRWCLWN